MQRICLNGYSISESIVCGPCCSLVTYIALLVVGTCLSSWWDLDIWELIFSKMEKFLNKPPRFTQEMIVSSCNDSASKVSHPALLLSLVILLLLFPMSMDSEALFQLSALQKSREKQYLFDIVANGRNGIDVDKYGIY